MKNKILVQCICGILLLIPALLFAGKEADDLVSSIQKKYNAINDITITFTQVSHEGNESDGPGMTGTITQQGKDKYRIEMEGQTIVSDGKTVWTFTKSTNQVLVDNYQDDSTVVTPEKILTTFTTQYDAQIVGKETLGAYQTTNLNMTPKVKDSPVKQMKVWVDDTQSLMRKVQVEFTAGNVVTYTINSVKLNGGVSEKLFTFTPPKDAEVVDMR